jgi:hypothetical protein
LHCRFNVLEKEMREGGVYELKKERECFRVEKFTK